MHNYNFVPLNKINYLWLIKIKSGRSIYLFFITQTKFHRKQQFKTLSPKLEVHFPPSYNRKKENTFVIVIIKHIINSKTTIPIKKYK